MKLLTLFVFFLSNLAFSAELDFSYIKKVMGEKNYQINKTIKSKSIRAHVCKEIEKDKEQRRKHSRSKDKSKRKHHRKHNFFKKLKRVSHFNKFGKKFINRDLTISEVENELPNLLTVQIDSKDIKGRKREKYTPVEIYYKVFNPEDSIKDRFKAPFETGALYEKDGKKRFDIDLSSLTLGEHDLFVKIVSYKTVHYGKKSKRKRKYIHFANLRFEKINLDSAHLVANVFGQTDTNSRIAFDLSNSYSDVGTLTLFNIKGFKNNELILNEDVLPENLTQLWFFFSENGQYHFEFTVTDSLGDTDTFISETYTPTLLSPTLNYTYTQDSEEKSVLHFDFSESLAPEGTSIRNYGVFIYQNDELVEEHISPIPKFSFAIEARGDMRLDVSIDTHQDQYSIESIQSFNLPVDVPKVNTINLSHSYDFRPDNPFKFGYAFRNDFNFDSVSKVNYKIVSETDTLQGEAEFYNLDGVEFHIYVEYPKVGNYNVEFQIETNDGSRFYPYSFDQDVDVDLGSANLAMSLNLINNGHSLNWTIDDSSSSAGNFGYFTGFTCKGVNQSTSETFEENSTDLIHEFPIARGTWNVDCFGTTNFGLVSNTLNFEIESLNQIPSASFNISAVIPNKKDITISTTQSDSDGEVTLGELSIQAPSGEIQNVNVIGEINLTLGEVGLHYFSFRVQDNEGAWSETSYQTYEVINDVPVANLQILALENRTFELIKEAQDSDGSVSEFYLTITSPQGEESSYTGFETLTVRLSEVGKWSISYYCVDNDGAQSIVKESEVSVTNIIPVASLEVTSREHEGSKRVLFKFNATDIDGDIDSAIVSVITPNGDRSDYEWGHSGEIEFDFWALGTHTIEFKAQDNDNTWSELVSATYEVINSAPIANLEVIPTDSPMDVIFRYSSSDSDGYIIEVLTIINTPSGESHEYTFGFEEDISFSFWEEGTHTISYLVKDDWGVWSEPSVVQYEAISPYSPPLAEIIIDPNTGSDRTINVTLRHSDTDGEVVEGYLTRITPSGIWENYDYLEGTYQISIDEIGTHEFRYVVVDNDGNYSEEVRTIYTFESDVPYPDYELTPTGNPGEYQFTPTYSDPSNLISYPELALFDPEGNWMGFRGDEARILNFDKIGEWRIVLSFFTHDGMRSDSNIKHVQIDELYFPPTFDLSINKLTEDQTFNFDASNTDYEYGIDSFKFLFSSPSGAVEEVVSQSGVLDKFFSEYGDWSVRFFIETSDGKSIESNEYQFNVEIPQRLIPIANFECETTELNELICNSEGSKVGSGSIEQFQWYINGSLVSGSQMLEYPYNDVGDFLVRLEVKTDLNHTAVLEQKYEVDTLYSTVFSEIKLTRSSNHPYFHNINEDIVLNVTNEQLITRDVYEGLVVRVNEAEITLPDFDLFENTIRIPKNSLIDNSNEITVSGFDGSDLEIKFQEFIIAGSNSISLNSAKSINKVVITSETDKNISYELNQSNLNYIPNDKYLLSVLAADGYYSTIIDLSESINLDITFNAIQFTDKNDFEFKNGLDGWNTEVANVSIKTEDLNDNQQNYLEVKPNGSGFAHIYKGYISDKDKISYQFEIIPSSVGSEYQVNLVNITQGKTKSKTYTVRELAENYRSSLTLENVNIGDNIYIEVKIKSTEAVVDSDSDRIWSPIKGAYANNGFNSTLLLRNSTWSINSAEIQNVNVPSKAFSKRPEGISVGPFNTKDIYGNVINFFPDENTGEGRNKMKLKASFELPNQDSSYLVSVYFRLNRDSGIDYDWREFRKDISELNVKFDFTSNSSQSISLDENVYLTHSDFSQFDYQNYDYFTLKVCLTEKFTSAVLTCENLETFLRSEKFKILMNLNINYQRHFSLNDAEIGGDVWVDSLLIDDFRKSLDETSGQIMVNDFSRMNGGFMASHLGVFNDTLGKYMGSHRLGNTIDFIPVSGGNDSLSLRKPIYHKIDTDDGPKDGLKYMILRNRDSANSLVSLLKANGGFFATKAMSIVADTDNVRFPEGIEDIEEFKSVLNYSCINGITPNMLIEKKRNHDNHWHMEIDTNKKNIFENDYDFNSLSFSYEMLKGVIYNLNSEGTIGSGDLLTKFEISGVSLSSEQRKHFKLYGTKVDGEVVELIGDESNFQGVSLKGFLKFEIVKSSYLLNAENEKDSKISSCHVFDVTKEIKDAIEFNKRVELIVQNGTLVGGQFDLSQENPRTLVMMPNVDYNEVQNIRVNGVNFLEEAVIVRDNFDNRNKQTLTFAGATLPAQSLVEYEIGESNFQLRMISDLKIPEVGSFGIKYYVSYSYSNIYQGAWDNFIEADEVIKTSNLWVRWHHWNAETFRYDGDNYFSCREGVGEFMDFGIIPEYRGWFFTDRLKNFNIDCDEIVGNSGEGYIYVY